MDIEVNELIEQLQGHWKLENEDQSFVIKGKEITVLGSTKNTSTTYELNKNIQLGNWQIKVVKPMSWLRTYIVKLTEDSFMLYDFDLKVQIAMGARSKLLNPSRIFRYARVEVPVDA